VASETGSTWNFAESFKSIFQESNRNIFICSVNEFQPHGGLKNVVILAATTGYGEAPANARNYETVLCQSSKDSAVDIAVVGFGSRAYPLFCKFAEDIEEHLRELNWANVVVPLHTVNNGSLKEFDSWCLAWSKTTKMPMAVGEEIAVNESRFSLKIQNVERQGDLIKWNIGASDNFKGNSGDYLVLKTPDGLEERLYSLAHIQENHYKVVFKVHKQGKCSQAMEKLKEGDVFWAKLIANPTFSIPQDCQNAVLIANGTGIAPFLGFLQELEVQRSIRFYWGCKDSAQRALFKEEFDQAISTNMLDLCEVIYSQEGPKQHVQELVKRDLQAVVQVLSGGGVVLVCGAISLQHDIESILETALEQAGSKTIGELKSNGQFLTDCYE
jgi:sulfite reductase (NADPH) flavoprotein alpha-component